MTLFNEVKKASEESFDVWFNRWYEKQGLENEIIKSAKKGYKGFMITIIDYGESENNFSEERKYENRRLRDKRTPEKIREKIGDEFEVCYKENTKKSKLFNTVEVTRYSEWIEIRWDK